MIRSWFNLPRWWPNLVWRVYPGERFGFEPIRRQFGIAFGAHLFIGFVATVYEAPE
jgi:hypothetical protein